MRKHRIESSQADRRAPEGAEANGFVLQKRIFHLADWACNALRVIVTSGEGRPYPRAQRALALALDKETGRVMKCQRDSLLSLMGGWNFTSENSINQYTPFSRVAEARRQSIRATYLQLPASAERTSAIISEFRHLLATTQYSSWLRINTLYKPLTNRIVL
jgi:hypothetical protein